MLIFILVNGILVSYNIMIETVKNDDFNAEEAKKVHRPPITPPPPFGPPIGMMEHPPPPPIL